jgi:hypothetical protein
MDIAELAFEWVMEQIKRDSALEFEQAELDIAVTTLLETLPPETCSSVIAGYPS